MPDVTVIVPTRDAWPILSASALPSALNQVDVDFEVIVVDDGSVDETASRLSQIEDKRLRVVRNEPARGVSGARNVGIEHALGDWLAFLDQDDLWSPVKLRCQLDDAARTGASLAYCSIFVVDERKRIINMHPAPDPGAVAAGLMKGNVIPGGGSGVMVRTDVVKAAGSFDESLTLVEEWDLWIRAVPRAHLVASDEVLMAYVEHSESLTVKLSEARYLAELAYLGKKCRKGDLSFKAVRSGPAVRYLASRNRRAGRRLTSARLYLRSAAWGRHPTDLARSAGALAGNGAWEGLRALLGKDSYINMESPPWLVPVPVSP